MTKLNKWKEEVKRLPADELEKLIGEMPRDAAESIFLFLYHTLEDKTSKEYVRQLCIRTLKAQQATNK